MENNQVTRILTDFRSYEYAAKNCGPADNRVPFIISERSNNPNVWDRDRYNRIVNMVKGALDEVLSDDHKTVINRKYLDRNTMNFNQIASLLNVDPSTVSRWHKEALRKLSIALNPLTESEMEINNFDHMFDREWRYKESVS